MSHSIQALHKTLLGVAASLVCSSTLASATITPIYQNSYHPIANADVSDSGDVILTTGGSDNGAHHIWSAQSQSFIHQEYGRGQMKVDVSNDGTRFAFLSHAFSSLSSPYHDEDTLIYTNGEETIISGQTFAAWAMSGNGKTLAGMNANLKPAILDIASGEITEITIEGLNLDNHLVSSISDDNQTLLVRYQGALKANMGHAYIIDLDGNIKHTIDLDNDDDTTTLVNISVTDMSGDGTAVGLRGFCDRIDQDALPVLYTPMLKDICSSLWRPSTGAVEFDPIDQSGNTQLNFNGTVMVSGKYIWDAVGGYRTLTSALQAKGVDLTGWSQLMIKDISSNGKYIVGNSSFNGVPTLFLVENNAAPQCTIPAF